MYFKIILLLISLFLSYIFFNFYQEGMLAFENHKTVQVNVVDYHKLSMKSSKPYSMDFIYDSKKYNLYVYKTTIESIENDSAILNYYQPGDIFMDVNESKMNIRVTIIPTLLFLLVAAFLLDSIRKDRKKY